MKKTCPKCGGENGYEFKDPGVMVYHGWWGKGKEGEEYVETEHHFKAPVNATCVDCGASVKLSEARRTR